MSAKWIRSREWDDLHLGGLLWPVKVVLRVLSSVWLGIGLLVLVALYGALASIPIGLVALAPTWTVYGASLVGTVAIGAVLPVWLGVRGMRAAGVGRPARVALGVIGVLALGVLSAWIWRQLVWPAVRFDPASGRGLRLFAEFVDRYQSVQLRRLPGVEMSELEFYGWWPLTLILLVFVVNMIVATVRRIEFKFVNLGVLSVHTGIVILALGSAFYAAHKQEGDVLLVSGGLDAEGKPRPGPPDNGFFDNIRPALWIAEGADGERAGAWEQRPLIGLPRYNDYNLGAVEGFAPPDPTEPGPAGRAHRDCGPLDLPVPRIGPGEPGHATVAPDLKFRVVGFAAYADLVETWVERKQRGGSGDRAGHRMREFAAILRAPGATSEPSDKATMTWRLIPDDASERVARLDLLALEHTRGMDDARWSALGENMPDGAEGAIVVEIPGDGGAVHRAVVGVNTSKTVAVGESGWSVAVKAVMAEAPFPIITPGYEGARSSVAVVRITPPESTGEKPFDRWVYHRFPEISQDFADPADAGGAPKRSAADPRVRVQFVDASLMQVYIDERPDGGFRALVRMPHAGAIVSEHVAEGGEVRLAPQLTLRIGAKFEDVERVEVPRVVPEAAREKARIGNHQNAAIALEITDGSGLAQVRWVPFTQYLGLGEGTERRVRLGDGRDVLVAFGRVRHEFDPPMSVRLVDFEMIPYPHSTTPRDYQSRVEIGQAWSGAFESSVQRTSLNEPLLVRAPFVARDDVPGVVNWIAGAASVLVPRQYKFSQAGWDQAGWRSSAEGAQRGEGTRPWARFTILGVGSNPGIYIIATGAVIFALGVPWAFYIKPLILRARKRKIQRSLSVVDRPEPALVEV